MKKLNHKEEEVMAILWRLEKAFVNDVLAQMAEPRPPYNTVSSVVRKLEAMGLVGHETIAGSHQYFPILKREDSRSAAARRFVDHYFGGSAAALLSYFVKEEEVSVDDINHLLGSIKEKLDKKPGP